MPPQKRNTIPPGRNALHNGLHRENGEPPHRQTKCKRKTGGLEDCTRLKGSQSLDDGSNHCKAPCAAKKAPAPRATKHAQRKWPQDAVAFKCSLTAAGRPGLTGVPYLLGYPSRQPTTSRCSQFKDLPACQSATPPLVKIGESNGRVAGESPSAAHLKGGIVATGNRAIYREHPKSGPFSDRFGM